jgi:hypothetical protein
LHFCVRHRVITSRDGANQATSGAGRLREIAFDWIVKLVLESTR